MILKPIHKFNGGVGATLCHKCRVIIRTGFTDDLFCQEHGGRPLFSYRLIRVGDKLIKNADTIKWIEWDEDGTFKESHDDIGIGRSLVLDFSYGNFKWMTTRVESYQKDQDIITFNTKNSTYKIYALTKE